MSSSLMRGESSVGKLQAAPRFARLVVRRLPESAGGARGVIGLRSGGKNECGGRRWVSYKRDGRDGVSEDFCDIVGLF